MSELERPGPLTQHAMLVIWGHFAHQIGLIQAMNAVALHQKTYRHRPQTKVLAVLVATLAGVAHLKEISHSAHPLDQDQAVAAAWQQPAWADASGVSRTLQALSLAEAEAIGQALEAISQPFIDREVVLAMRTHGRLVYDGDLTGRPVSNSSTSYPNVAYGYMSDALCLGYQAALVSLHSPTYGRVWLSVRPHPGNTIACTQAEAIILAAEARTGVRPRRRVELLRQRLAAITAARQQAEARLATAQQALTAIHAQANDLSQHRQHWQHEIQRLEAVAQARQRPERPHSQVATARQRLLVCERRMARQPRLIERAQQRVLRQQRQVEARAAIEASLTSRLARFEDENRRNPTPVEAVFRLDAGFGTGENVALLIEMGYDVYTKPYHHQVTTRLRRTVSETTAWTRVGANAEVVAWSNQQMAGCPYPLELALERFYTGATVRYSTLLHSGSAPVIGDLLPWFQFYNGRQLIEAGIKEGKNVFQMHHLKIRSAPGLLIQEYCALFAANFVRWAAHWLATDCRHTPLPAPGSPRLPVKELVQVAAHTSAWVESLPDGYRLTFTDQSAYAGKRLQTATWAFQLPLPLFKSCDVPAFLLV